MHNLGLVGLVRIVLAPFDVSLGKINLGRIADDARTPYSVSLKFSNSFFLSVSSIFFD